MARLFGGLGGARAGTADRDTVDRYRSDPRAPDILVAEAVVIALFLRSVSTRAARYTTDHRAARGSDRIDSTVSRSAVPAPCATQTPEQARMMGSSAVTMPLAGTCTTGFLLASKLWM